MEKTRPVIILLHDSFGCIELWRDFPEKLSNLLELDVIIYDRQGYGKSDKLHINSRKNSYMEDEADVLIGLMNEQDISEAILFGHSDGATISLIAAAKYPEMVSAVISEAAHVFVEKVTLKGIKQAVYAYNNQGLKSRLEKYHTEKTDLLFKLWSETWLSDKYQSWNIFDILKNIHCPVLVIQGENDEFGTKKQVDIIHNSVSGEKEILMIPNVGHTPHKDALSICLDKTNHFINKYF